MLLKQLIYFLAELRTFQYLIHRGVFSVTVIVGGTGIGDPSSRHFAFHLALILCGKA